MAEDVSPGFDVGELEKLLMKAKSTGSELTFGFGLTPKPDDCVLLLHLRKPPSAMKKEARSLPVKVSKSCGGTVTVVDKDVRFLPEKAVKGMIKQLKKRFRDAGMAKFKPVLVGPDGAEIDEETLPDDDGPDTDDDAVVAAVAPPPEAAPAPADPALAELKRRLAAILPKVQALAPEVAEKLRQACMIAGQQIARGETDAATTTIGRIEDALARQTAAPPAPPPPPAVPVAKLQEAMAKLIPRIRALPEGDARADLGARARDIMGMINEGAADRALAAIRLLSQDLTTAEGAPGAAPTEARTAAPGDPMMIWQDAKEAADMSITALQKAIRGIDHPDLQRIADMGLNGVTDGFQTALMKALFEYKQSPAGEARAKAAANIAAKARELRARIEGDQIIALCESNPFNVAVSIRAPLSSALTRLEKLAA